MLILCKLVSVFLRHTPKRGSIEENLNGSHFAGAMKVTLQKEISQVCVCVSYSIELQPWTFMICQFSLDSLP